MRVTADTNLLLRVIVADDAAQQRLAIKALESAELVVISTHALCELVWVMDRRYGTSRSDIARTIRALLDTRNVIANRAAVEAGLALLEAGGDFADGVIAFEGRGLGGETFLSFDKTAVKLLKTQKMSAHLLP